MLKNSIYVLLLILVAFVSFELGNRHSQNDVVQTESKKQISSTQSILGLINAQRGLQNLEPLRENAKLNASAYEKACDMVEREYFGHLDPSGREPWHLLEAEGYLFAYAGENLIEGYETDQQAMNAIMESPSHRENVLSAEYADIGVGRCGPYVVQHFGRVKYN